MATTGLGGTYHSCKGPCVVPEHRASLPTAAAVAAAAAAAVATAAAAPAAATAAAAAYMAASKY